MKRLMRRSALPDRSYALGPHTKAKAFIADYAERDYSGFVGPGQGSLD
jgi:hypothetical protein